MWSKVIAALILSAGAAAWAIVPDKPVVRLAVVVLLVVGVALAGWLIVRPKIVWTYENFLGMVSGGGQLLVNSFQATGRNRSRRGIRSVGGHLVSNIDNTRSGPLQFVIGGQPVEPRETTGIPPGATFQIMIPFTESATEPRLSEHQFLSRWRSFRVVVQLDDMKHEKNFSEKRVMSLIERFKRVANPPSPPAVRQAR